MRKLPGKRATASSFGLPSGKKKSTARSAKPSTAEKSSTAGNWWKVAGLAGFVGVVATGAVIAQAERRRRAYTPDEIRSRLHARHAEAAAAAAEEPPAG